MNTEIYNLAVSCKQFADKQIETYRIMAVDPQYGIEYQKSSGVRGDIKGYEKILLELRKAIAGKYTLIEKQLEEEMNSYDRHPILHQGKIEAIVETIISLELQDMHSESKNTQPKESYVGVNHRKFFISHSSNDKTIIECFIKEILLLGCGVSRNDIFCTLDSTAIRTGDDFREQIIKNMRECDYILLFISENYNNSEVCKNELGASWAFVDKRTLPLIFPNLSFNQMGFLNITKQGASLADRKKLDEFYDEVCTKYSIKQDWKQFNKCKEDFIELLNKSIE